MESKDNIFVLPTRHATTPGPAATHDLPVPLTSLVGREQEVAVVQNLLHQENVRLVTLTGPGGTGKTRLGLQVAAQLSDLFPDGVYFVNLAPINDPEFVVPTIAQTLGIREVSGQSQPERLKEELQQQQVLLLLDNFEQVVAAAPQVTDLLVACPKLKVLVTSREVLRVRAEREFAVPPLALPDPTHLPELAVLWRYEAVALFIQRAQAVKLDFQVTRANARTIAEICVRLDGLPLAIELAAARVKLLPPQALLARLDQRLQVLASGARDAPARQQSLRNTIAWSYDLLNAEEQRLFRRLSVFVGGCTLEAVEAICSALDDGVVSVLADVASLIDKSLLQQTEQEGEEPRLLMLETIREYGLECLSASREKDLTRQAHAEYFLALAEEAEPEFHGPQQAVWLERFEREHDNLRAVMWWLLEQGEAGQGMEMALRLGAALGEFWILRSHLSEGRIFLERVLAASPRAGSRLRAKALSAAADLALVQFDRQGAEVLAEEGLVLCQQLEDQAGIAYCLYVLGVCAMWGGEYAQARARLRESAALFRARGNKFRLGWSLVLQGVTEQAQGQHAGARAHYEEALALFRDLGNVEGMADMHFNLGLLLFYSQGDTLTARSLLEEASRMFREEGNTPGGAVSLVRSAEVALLGQRNLATADVQAEEALGLFRELSYKGGMAEALFVLAQGLTDAQIAEQLVLSLHTIHAHLRTIYSKLGVTSRSAATRFAFEHQLM